jgi:hypothetical protein
LEGHVNDRLIAAFEALDSALTEVGEALIETDPETLEEACVRWDLVDRARRQMSDSLAYTLSCVTSMPGKKPEFLVLPTGTTVEFTWSKSRRAWQHDALRREVIRRAGFAETLVDPATGESTSPGQIIEEFMRYAHVDYWKVKSLAAIGVEVDEYSEGGAERPTLSLKPNR